MKTWLNKGYIPLIVNNSLILDYCPCLFGLDQTLSSASDKEPEVIIERDHSRSSAVKTLGVSMTII